MPGTLGCTSQSIDLRWDRGSIWERDYQVSAANTTRPLYPGYPGGPLAEASLPFPDCATEARSLHPGYSASLFQQCGNGLDSIAGIFRQPGADRISGVERAVAREHLRGHEIA